jgi:hypothetical protein
VLHSSRWNVVLVAGVVCCCAYVLVWSVLVPLVLLLLTS